MFCVIWRQAAQEFLDSVPQDLLACLVLDVGLPGHSGLDFQEELATANLRVLIIFSSGHAAPDVGSGHEG